MTETTTLPEGDYAIVEILGHRTLVGRVSEVERFGSKLMQIEPIWRGALIDPVMVSGGSIYFYTPCSRTVAAERAPDAAYQLPPPVRAVMPPALLAAPESDAGWDAAIDIEEEEDA